MQKRLDFLEQILYDNQADLRIQLPHSEKAFKNDSVHDTAVSEVSDAISAARAKGLKKQEIIDILNEIYTQEEEL